MKPSRLDQLLEMIRDAIPGLDDVDEKGREILDGLDSDMRALAETEDADRGDESLLKRMQDAVAHFEVTHPTLTALISEASAILSGAGI